MKHIIVAGVILFLVVGGLVYADSQWGASEQTKAPSSPIVVPVYLTAPPAIPDNNHLWACLRDNTGAGDRNNFVTIDLSSEYDGRIFTYSVYNVARDETRAVTIEYTYGNDGQVNGYECTVPNEWTNGGLLPAITPYREPTEIGPGQGIGEPES